MLTDTITLDKALLLEEQGKIYIFDGGKETDYHSKARQWQDNYHRLRTKARHIPPQKLPSYFNAKYTIEIPIKINPYTYSWRYLRAMDVNSLASINTSVDDIEYVYALINKGYPDLVKIGMTTNTPEHRVNQINGTGTVELWEVKFALPIIAGKAMQVEKQVHKIFQHKRLHIRHENDREMFEIDIFQAIDKIREVGSLFQAGNPIIY